jgi:hypothetical protein
MKKLAITGIVLLLLASSLFQACIYVGPPQVVTFQSTPESVAAGQSATIVWVVTGANTVNIDPDLGTVATAGSRQVNPATTTTYTLTASNVTGTSNASLTVAVQPALSISSFDANPSVIQAGQSSTLQWNVTGASSVNISPDLGNVELSGSRTVSPSSTQTYTLTAVSGGQVTSRAVTVQVTAPPVVVQFIAAPASISAGGATTISWNVTGANTVSIQPDLGTVPAAGSRVVYPSTTTVYVLSASSSCCVVNRSVTVQVAQFPVPSYLPVINLFNINPQSIYQGGSATLQWNVQNADTVVINQGIGPVSPSGFKTVTPTGTTYYTITATNLYGYRTVTIGIVVFGP